jgi:hypothetical protein
VELPNKANSLSTALYTTVYPGVEKFLAPWCQSLKEQTDQQIDLWVGIDHANIDLLKVELTQFGDIHEIHAHPEDTPAQIRERAIIEIIESHEIIIFVDSDDIMMPTRVETAKKALYDHQVYGCSLEIVDENGISTGSLFGIPQETIIDELLPKGNIFGMSNTAYRTEILRQCLPIPPQCLLVDWYLSSNAWAMGAKFTYDPTVQMKYRQYGENTASVLPPFSKEKILNATRLVIDHYRLLLEYSSVLQDQKRNIIEVRLAQTYNFLNTLSASRDKLDRYVEQINQRPMENFWWAYVAHPALEELWKN